jgi:hypothetical protein
LIKRLEISARLRHEAIDALAKVNNRGDELRNAEINVLAKTYRALAKSALAYTLYSNEERIKTILQESQGGVFVELPQRMTSITGGG